MVTQKLGFANTYEMVQYLTKIHAGNVTNKLLVISYFTYIAYDMTKFSKVRKPCIHKIYQYLIVL